MIRDNTSGSTSIRRSRGPPIGGRVERDMNSKDTPRSRRWDFAGEADELESEMHSAVLGKT